MKADGSMTFVDEMNLKGVSPLAREVLGFEAEGTDTRRRAQRARRAWLSIKHANSSDVNT